MKSITQPSYTYVKSYSQRIDCLRMPSTTNHRSFNSLMKKKTLTNMLLTLWKLATILTPMMTLWSNNLCNPSKIMPSIGIPTSSQDHRQLWATWAWFFNRFYNTRRVVSMIELKSTQQWKDELVIDCIQKWKNLNLDYKKKWPFESTSFDICNQWMN